MVYAWNKTQWEHVMQRRAALPHALLLRGRAGLGKVDFATALAHTLLCQQEAPAACGSCPSCTWLKEGVHPDFKLITPEDESSNDKTSKKKTTKKTQISVDQIRALYDYLSLTTHQVQGYRIILITPAEALNLAAANALLKMLEEPPANTLFILVANQSQRLLPTIISRCQVIDFSVPATDEALDWLQSQGVNDAETALAYAGGAPLTVLQMQAALGDNNHLIQQLATGRTLDPSRAAPLFLAVGMENAVQIVQKWCFDLLNYKLTETLHYHVQQTWALQVLCKSVNLSALLQFQHSLNDAKKSANHPLSNEMQLEHLLLQYTHVFNA